MPAITPPAPRARFDADAIERLAILLLEEGLPQGGMPLEAVDGLFSAALVSPGAPIDLAEVMPLVLGSRDAVASDELRDLLSRLWEATRARIVRGPTGDLAQSLPLILFPDAEDDEADASVLAEASDEGGPGEDFDEGEPFPVGAVWALGFSVAYGLRATEWEARLEEDEYLFQAVMDIFDLIPPPWEHALPGEEGDEALDEDEDEDDDDFDLFADEGDFGEAAPAADPDDGEFVPCADWDDDPDDELPLTYAERVDVIGSLPEILHECHLSRIAEATPRTPTRVAEAPGRNDPCPCGSGLKFKKCHGDPSRLN